jgi:hypothetical protein
MKQDGTIELFHYWNRLRNGRPAPRRTDVEPADIKRLLADTFILEKAADGLPTFRLAGTRLCATFGRELKGYSFLSLWRERDQALIARTIESAFEARAVVVVVFEGASSNAHTHEFELIALPLDGGRFHPRVLGSMAAGNRPYWIGADPIVECQIASVRVVDPEREPLFLKNRPALSVPPLAPDATAFTETVRPGTGRRIRHLVVYNGGRGN